MACEYSPATFTRLESLLYSFRWVQCQFESLRRCPRSEYHTERCLDTLPRTLDETYERILINIDPDFVAEAKRILTLLCFSLHPMTFVELRDGIAMDIGETPRLDITKRFQDENDILKICPGLVDIHSESSEADDDENELIYFEIAHFSVQEYLESDRLKTQGVIQFAMDWEEAHAEIAMIFLAYLLELRGWDLSPTALDSDYPMARVAARSWNFHYEIAECQRPQLQKLVLEIFDDRRNLFLKLGKLHYEFRLGDGSPEYCASYLGLPEVLEGLLCRHSSGQERPNAIVARKLNVYQFSNALEAAISQKHPDVVEILLHHKCEFGDQSAFFGKVLHLAVTNGDLRSARLLLDNGANVNNRAGSFAETSPLHAAALEGDEGMVKFLLEFGAEIDATNRFGKSALMEAREFPDVVELLLARGAKREEPIRSSSDEVA